MLQGMKYGPAASHGVEVHNTQPYEVSKTCKDKIVILSATFPQRCSMNDCCKRFFHLEQKWYGSYKSVPPQIKKNGLKWKKVSLEHQLCSMFAD